MKDNVEDLINKIEVEYREKKQSAMEKAVEIQQNFNSYDRVEGGLIDHYDALISFYEYKNENRRTLIEEYKKKFGVQTNLLEKASYNQTINSLESEINKNNNLIGIINELRSILKLYEKKEYVDILFMLHKINELLSEMNDLDNNLISSIGNAKNRYEETTIKQLSSRSLEQLVRYLRKELLEGDFIGAGRSGVSTLLDMTNASNLSSQLKTQFKSNNSYDFKNNDILKKDEFSIVFYRDKDEVKLVTGVDIGEYSNLVLDSHRIKVINKIIDSLIPKLGEDYGKIVNILNDIKSNLDKKQKKISKEIEKIISKYENATGRKVKKNEEEKIEVNSKFQDNEVYPGVYIEPDHKPEEENKIAFLADILFRIETSKLDDRTREYMLQRCEEYKEGLDAIALKRIEERKKEYYKNESENVKELMVKKIQGDLDNVNIVSDSKKEKPVSSKLVAKFDLYDSDKLKKKSDKVNLDVTKGDSDEKSASIKMIDNIKTINEYADVLFDVEVNNAKRDDDVKKYKKLLDEECQKFAETIKNQKIVGKKSMF